LCTPSGHGVVDAACLPPLCAPLPDRFTNRLTYPSSDRCRLCGVGFGQGAKPVLTEKGPYAYRDRRRKLNVTFSEDGDQVTFFQQQW
jgi:hypothetical protein